MSRVGLQQAIRDVLPALNFQPGQFELDRGFLLRAARRDGPSVLTIDGVADQMVFLGRRTTIDHDEDVERLGREAVGVVARGRGNAAKRMIVAWFDDDGNAFAAAFVLSAEGGLGDLLGSSWSPPDSWPTPAPNASKSVDEAIGDALSRVASVIERRAIEPDFEATLRRALTLVDLELRREGGEGQDTSVIPAADDSDAAWDAWLGHYQRSIGHEWRRIRGSAPSRAPAQEHLPATGPLKGLTAFLSYAWPDATRLAGPVRAALQACGAAVWFAQEQPLESDQLNHGLVDAIARCDAYIMCASDEFIERAGYATQEFAWAVRQLEARTRAMHFMVVVLPGTVLPSLVMNWPTVEFHGDAADLKLGLVDILGGDPAFTPTTPEPPRMTQPPRDAVPVLALEADLGALRQRVTHVRRIYEVDNDSVVAIAEGKNDGRFAAVRALLIDLGNGLGWSGTLGDMARWPEDALIRDARWRLGTARAVAGTRWPLTGDLDNAPAIAEDVALLATGPIPIFEWATTVGWGENERRLALRYHAGLLRMLQEMLARGLWGGLLQVPSSVLDRWQAEVEHRRRECHDGLIELRLQGLLSWTVEPPTWDGLFVSWQRLLSERQIRWRDPVPPDVLLLLTASADDFAALAAQTIWPAARYPGFFLQACALLGVQGPVHVEVFAVQQTSVPNPADDHERAVRLGVVAGHGGEDPEVTLSWTTANGHGSAAAPAPDWLRQSMSFLSI
jgi:hypothetical protein